MTVGTVFSVLDGKKNIMKGRGRAIDGDENRVYEKKNPLYDS